MSNQPKNLVPAYSEITPRYGRDYTSGKAAKAAFQEGLDFTLASTGQAMSIRDVGPGTPLLLRFKRNTGVVALTVTKAMLAALDKPAYDAELAERAAIQADAENERDGYRD